MTAADRALWERVAATVKPLPGRAAISLPAAAPAPAGRAETKPQVPAPALPLRQKPQLPPMVATLDGRWDRQLAKGRMRPERTIDLHGHGLESAHRLLMAAIALAAADGVRLMLVITGRGRPDRPGRIRAEFPAWLNQLPLVAAVRPASPRHGGSGAFYLVLRRRPGE